VTAPFDFAGKRVLIGGGSRGIGRGIAVAFAHAGATVFVSGRDAAALEETRAACGSSAHVGLCDLADPDAVVRSVATAADLLGGIDVVVNNGSAFARTDDETGWNTAFSVDMMGVVRTNAAAVPVMAASGGGAIINIASISAFHPTPRAAPYGAIKAAIVHYTASQALAFAGQNIRVNAVAPGAITFPGHFWEQRKRDDTEDYRRIVAQIPFGRLGTPEEIADVVLFLASPLSRWMTGQTLTVDGGQEIGR
jgi:3-oxoacyl-[acyl-carrier protein] reductase